MKQIIVTKKGQGIIPKALANGEIIKFTKVCISDKDYAGVELCNLESIESVKQEVSVDNVHVINDTQVEVVCTVDNENLTDAYYIRTIGIYANDSKGNEILYGVSISENVPKYMPKYEGKTLTGILYRLTINIDNADNVVTDVNNATVANVLEVQLIEKRVTDVEKRVTTTEGKVQVVENLATILEKRVEKTENTITQFANPNILINSNFKMSALVNQRGEVLYHNSNHSSRGYIFDMWQVIANMNFTITLETSSIKFKNTSGSNGYAILQQPIENFKNLEGKTVTFSFKAKSDNGSEIGSNIRIDNKDFNNKNFTCSKDFQVFRYTTTFPETIENSVIFRVFINNVNADVDIEWIKAEIGDIATPFVDDDPATKLTKCQRYLVNLNNKNAPFLIIGNGVARTNLYAYIMLEINPMRISFPTLIYDNLNSFKLSVYKESPWTYISPKSMIIEKNYSDAKQGKITIYASFELNPNLKDSDFTSLQFFNVANSYFLLSAEV